MNSCQYTLAAPFTFSGKTLHSGRHATVTFLPAESDTGYCFLRTDLHSPFLPATANFVRPAERCSCLDWNGIQMHTMEHALSALYIMGIDNCLMEVNGDELPILDGSARLYVEAIQRVGLIEQAAPRHYIEVKEPLSVSTNNGNTLLTVTPDNRFSVDVTISFNSPYLSHQEARFIEGDDYATEIAPCRTFVFLQEVEMLLSHGLIKGGDLSSAIVIADRTIAKEEIDRLAEQFGYSNLEIREGIISTTPLLYPNEPARHKLLDLMGDLALSGGFIHGHITAMKPGHTANTALARRLFEV